MIAGVVVQGTKKDHLVGMAGMAWQRFGNADAGDIGVDSPKRPAIFRRRFRLRIVGLELTGPAVEPDENDGGVTRGGAFGPHSQHVGLRQSEHTEEAGLECGAARYALAVGGDGAVLELQHWNVPPFFITRLSTPLVPKLRLGTQSWKLSLYS
jgi:hypothetical protein